MTTPPTNNWISVNDKKPPGGQWVLIAWRNQYGVERAYYLYPDDLWWNGDSYTSRTNPPTHWQPLPEPPPKPDAFEVWWSRQKRTGGNDPQWRTLDNTAVINSDSARVVWNAALASTKESAS